MTTLPFLNDRKGDAGRVRRWQMKEKSGRSDSAWGLEAAEARWVGPWIVHTQIKHEWARSKVLGN